MTSVLRWGSAVSATMAADTERSLTGPARVGTSRSTEDRPTDGTRDVALETGAANDDRTIVEAVLAGDHDAYRRLVERESASVVAACARILGDRSEAEDVAQEAFVIAFRSLGSWRAEGPFGAWLSRIAVRLAVRSAGRRRQVTWLDPMAAESDEPGQDRYRTSGASDAIDPAHAVLRAEQDAHIRSAVASLDEPYREVVALRFFAERSLLEIAEATDRPLGTVKTHLHRGLARLRKALEDHER
ncbi:MAG TPA: sigma-70 family RNA polymerase sigma factor [Candidatus Limnocylindrales bacterium]